MESDEDMSESNDECMATAPTYKCERCGQNFSGKSTLRRHVKNLHPEVNYLKVVPMRKKNIRCPLCPATFYQNSTFLKHQKEAHESALAEETLAFYSVEDFKSWKAQIELETVASFVVWGNKRLADGSQVVYYKCNRSGFYKSEGKGIRSVKKLGTNKIGFVCPARIRTVTVIRNDIPEIKVWFQKQHFGHSMDINRVRMPTQMCDESQKNGQCAGLEEADSNHASVDESQLSSSEVITVGVRKRKQFIPNRRMAEDDESELTQELKSEDIDGRKVRVVESLNKLISSVQQSSTTEELNIFDEILPEVHQRLKAVRKRLLTEGLLQF